MLLHLLRTGTLAILLLAGPLARAQAPVWQAAVSANSEGGPNFSSVTAMTTDANGDLYLTGVFAGTVRFGNFTLTGSPGIYDIFVAKWNQADRRFDWAQRAGGSGYDFSFAIAVAGSSVYIAGSVQNGPITFGAISPTGTGSTYVAKLTQSATGASFAWAVLAGGNSTDDIRGLAVSGTDIYVGGTLASAQGTFGTTLLTNADASGNTADVFVAHITDTGSNASYTWAQRAGGLSVDIAYALALNGTSLYLVGDYSGESASFGTLTLPNKGKADRNYDAFVAKLTLTGTGASFTWVQRAGGTNSDGGRTLAVSGTSLYLGGSLISTDATFGALNLTGLTAHAGYLARLTDMGGTSSFDWVQPLGDDAVLAVAAQGTTVYATGDYYSSTATFGGTTLSNATASTSNIFVAKLLDAGSTSSLSWVQMAGGADSDNGRAVVANGTLVYVAGVVGPPADFSSQAITTPVNSTTAFLAWLPVAGVLATAPPLLATDLVVYPNPAHGVATVRVPAGAGPATLTLLDALGRVVRITSAPAGADYPLGLAGIAPGLYTLRLQAGEALATQQLAVE